MGENLNLWPAYVEFCVTNDIDISSSNEPNYMRSEIRSLTRMRIAIEEKLAQLYGTMAETEQRRTAGMRYFSYDKVSDTWKFTGPMPQKADTLIDSLRKGNFIPQGGNYDPVDFKVNFKYEHYEPTKEDDTGKSFTPEAWAAIKRATYR